MSGVTLPQQPVGSSAAEDCEAGQPATATETEQPAAELPAQSPGATADGNRAADSEPASDKRVLEALLFASGEPLGERELMAHLGLQPSRPPGPRLQPGEPGETAEANLAEATPEDGLRALLGELRAEYATRGVNLVRVAGKWAFRTAPDLGYLLEQHKVQERRLSRAALETLAIVAYHQPVTRAEIEAIRGVSTSKGTLDVLLETGWLRMRGRRRAPGRPVTYGTTNGFLEHFGLESIKDLPGLGELKGAGLLDNTVPPDFNVPEPMMLEALAADEDPLEDEDDDEPMPDLFGEDDEGGIDARGEGEGDSGDDGADAPSR